MDVSSEKRMSEYLDIIQFFLITQQQNRHDERGDENYYKTR